MNGWLGPGEELVAGRYRLRNTPNGELVLTVDGWATLWSSGIGAPGWAIMQDDGNFVLYRDDGLTWSTGTQGHDGAHLELKMEGELVVYAPPWEGGGVLWATPTHNGVPPNPTLTINGLGEGAQVTLHTHHQLAVHASGIPGTSFDLVQLVTYPGEQLLDTRGLLGEHDTTLYFDYPTLPASGHVIAHYYRDIYQDGEPVQRLLMATSPVVTIPPPSLSVNGVACCQTLSINHDDALVVSVNNYSGHATDWVGLFRVGAPYDQPVDKKYLNDSAIEPPATPQEEATLHFDPVLVQGWDYEFRLYESGTTSPIAAFTFIRVNVMPPSLTINGVGSGGQLDLAMGQALVVNVAHTPTSPYGPVFIATLKPEGDACNFPVVPNWQIQSETATISASAPVAPGSYRLYVCRLADDSESWSVAGDASPRLVVHAPVLTVNGAGDGETVRSRPNALLTAQVRWAPDLTDIVEIRTLSGRLEGAYGVNGDQQIATTVAFGTPNPLSATTVYKARLLRTDGTPRAQGPQIRSVGALQGVPPDGDRAGGHGGGHHRHGRRHPAGRRGRGWSRIGRLAGPVSRERVRWGMGAQGAAARHDDGDVVQHGGDPGVPGELRHTCGRTVRGAVHQQCERPSRRIRVDHCARG
ncbi:MAG: hypothetical protein QM736_03945 [Vicinamibacterales bacterium]